MPDTYRLYGTKKQGEAVSSVSVGSKTLTLRGEAVELTDNQVEDLRARGFDVRKMPSSGDDEKSSSEDSPQDTQTNPKS